MNEPEQPTCPCCMQECHELFASPLGGKVCFYCLRKDQMEHTEKGGTLPFEQGSARGGA